MPTKAGFSSTLSLLHAHTAVVAAGAAEVFGSCLAHLVDFTLLQGMYQQFPLPSTFQHVWQYKDHGVYWGKGVLEAPQGQEPPEVIRHIFD